MSFTHLHVHTEYSLLDGASRIADLVKRAKELNMNSIAITDHGNMYGVIEFYKKCKDADIKPIIGMEAYVAPKTIYDKTGMRENAHIILLAKNEQGYKNLIKLSSIAYVDGFYYRPRIDYSLIEKYHDGLICLSACLAGDIPSYLLENRYDDAKALALKLKSIFGDDFYIELQNHGIPEQLVVLPKLASLADELQIKTVATNDVHYVLKADAEAQDVLMCIQTGKTVDEPNRMRMQTEEFYLKSEDEMLNRMHGYEDAVKTTAEIADKCNVNIEFGKRHLPGFTAPDGMTNEQYIRKLCDDGLRMRYGEPTDEHRERLDYELGVITNMGFVDYYLIVWDFIRFAKSNGIEVGPGRGSGAASIAAYAMGITDLDPIKYNLLFERFLNPERVSMPDFDVDFCYERRQEVIEYVRAKYGEDHVAQIVTFGTMAARGSVRDVGRVLNMPYSDVDKIAKLIPQTKDMDLKTALETIPELKEQYSSNDQIKRLIDLALKVEGLPRNTSTHAAGVVISSLPTMELVPLQRNDEAITTQFTMTELEELGMLKMDFLGLRTLTVIRDCLDLARASGKEVPDFANCDYSDPRVYELISSGETVGVFQLESAGMTQFMMQMKPTCLEDIIAGISLFRPGPMDQIPRYIQGKQNADSVTYETELLRPILNTTYGCMVYQEQVMQIVRDLAGYSLGRSDLVRRAMSKKKHDVMAKERRNFIYGIEEDGIVKLDGALRRGVSLEAANKIFDEMMDFASYAFNKAHAACYAVVAYRTALLKCLFPVEFLTALLNSFLTTPDKISSYVFYCRTKGIRVLPPNINISSSRFSVDDGAIVFGLSAVKNVGAAIYDVIEERTRNGKFKDFSDFVKRSSKGINKRALEGLITAGCFDCFGMSRKYLMSHYEHDLSIAGTERKRMELGQISMFDFDDKKADTAPAPLTAEQVDEFPLSELLQYEHNALGLYLSGHPLMDYGEELKDIPFNCDMLSNALEGEPAALTNGTKVVRFTDGMNIKLACIISKLTTKTIKSSNLMMAVGTLEDMGGSIEFVAFPSIYQKYAAMLGVDQCVVINGRISIREDKANSVVIDSVSPLTKGGEKRLAIHITQENQALFASAMDILRRYPGSTEVAIKNSVTNKAMLVPREMYVSLSDELLNRLIGILGDANVIIINKKR